MEEQKLVTGVSHWASPTLACHMRCNARDRSGCVWNIGAIKTPSSTQPSQQRTAAESIRCLIRLSRTHASQQSTPALFAPVTALALRWIDAFSFCCMACFSGDRPWLTDRKSCREMGKALCLQAMKTERGIHLNQKRSPHAKCSLTHKLRYLFLRILNCPQTVPAPSTGR